MNGRDFGTRAPRAFRHQLTKWPIEYRSALACKSRVPSIASCAMHTSGQTPPSVRLTCRRGLAPFFSLFYLIFIGLFFSFFFSLLLLVCGFSPCAPSPSSLLIPSFNPTVGNVGPAVLLACAVVCQASYWRHCGTGFFPFGNPKSVEDKEGKKNRRREVKRKGRTKMFLGEKGKKVSVC